MRVLLLLILLPIGVFGQNTIGLPDVINYTKQTYSGGLQNWDIKQDKNGIIYIANNEGLLSFDGKYWNLYPLPHKTIVRAVEIGPDNNIYVGGQDELGYFSPGKNGRLQYHSLSQFIPEKDRSFSDVWDIATLNKNVFFRSKAKIFQFTGEAVVVYNAPSEWGYLGLEHGQIVAQDYKTGLMKIEHNECNPIFSTNSLPENDAVTSLISLPGDSTLIATLKNGLFILTSKGVAKLVSANNSFFQNERIYGATTINKDWVAIATNNSGIYIIDLKGNIIQRLSKTEGLQNNNVLSIFLDRQSNLWLALDNGIDFIAYNSAIKQITPLLQDGSGYTALIHDQKLFLGTTNGLYSVPLQPVKDLSFSKGNFIPVNNIQGQTWGLAEINSHLLLGHHEGAFEVNNNTATPISHKPGFWNFIPLSTTYPVPQIVAGYYNGIVFFNYKNNQFVPSADTLVFGESSRFISIDQDDNIWVSHPYHGVYKINKAKTQASTVHLYTEKQGLPSALNNHVYKIKNQVVFATEKGVFIYNIQKDIFEPSKYYRNILGEQSIRYLKEDQAGNIWFIHDKTLGIIDLSENEPQLIYLPELNNKMLSGFEFIYPVNANNIFLGGEKGFYHINYEKYKQSFVPFQVQVRSVRVINETDSILFGGYYAPVNEPQIQNAKTVPELPYHFKTIRLEFASAVFGLQSNLEYSYRLKGFEDTWSEWTVRTEKEYTNLPTRNYSFEVKVRSNHGVESAIASYNFIVLPPWYRTVWAFCGYFLLLNFAVFFLIRWQQKKFYRQKEMHDAEQKKLQYLHALEINQAENEIIVLRNEKLNGEINHKNSELATSAMHLVQKGVLISKIKDQIVHVMKELDSEKGIDELKKMKKILSEDEKKDKEWEQFAQHFDKVHSDFTMAVKEKHPAITSNELKLCAYVRMNISTKEIAQLMNISVRGVEISRYRLRKKLGISTEKNLFDYLIQMNHNS